MDRTTLQRTNRETGELERVPAHFHDVAEHVTAGLRSGDARLHLGEWRDHGAAAATLPRLLTVHFRRRPSAEGAGARGRRAAGWTLDGRPMPGSSAASISISASRRRRTCRSCAGSRRRPGRRPPCRSHGSTRRPAG
jgi:hypothetical protein